MIASGSRDGNILVFNVNGEQVFVIADYLKKGSINSICFSRGVHNKKRRLLFSLENTV